MMLTISHCSELYFAAYANALLVFLHTVLNKKVVLKCVPKLASYVYLGSLSRSLALL
jgi:hypothetical protein